MRKLTYAVVLLACVVSLASAGWEWQYYYKTTIPNDPYAKVTVGPDAWKKDRNIVAETDEDNVGHALANGYATRVIQPYPTPCSNWVDVETLVTYLCPPVQLDAGITFRFELYHNLKIGNVDQGVPDFGAPLHYEAQDANGNLIDLGVVDFTQMEFDVELADVWYKAHVPHYNDAAHGGLHPEFDGIPFFHKLDKLNFGYWVVVRAVDAPSSNIFMWRDGSWSTPALHGARLIYTTTDGPEVKKEPNPHPPLPAMNGDPIIAALVSKHDWKLDAINKPAKNGTYPAGTSMIPQVKVSNVKPFGHVPENDPFIDKANIHLWIVPAGGGAPVYDQTLTDQILPDGPLPANKVATYNFPAWGVNVPAGTYTVKCTLDHWNDWSRLHTKVLTQNFTVTATDAGVNGIFEPMGSYVENTPVTPSGELKNCGNVTVTAAARFWIDGTDYDEVVTVSDLAPGDLRTINFPEYMAGPVGSRMGHCIVTVSGDVNPANNQADLGFEVTPASQPRSDVGVLAVTAPTSIIRRWSRYAVKATVKNYGEAPATFPVVAKLTAPNGGLFEYTAMVNNLAAGAETEVTFATRRFNNRGAWSTLAYTELVGDVNPANDAAHGSFEVRGHRGWIPLCGIPNSQVARTGGSMVSNGSNEFYVLLGKYNASILHFNSEIDAAQAIGYVPETGGKVGTGTTMAYLGGKIYVLTANKSLSFQVLDLSNNTWTTLSNIPAKARVGAALTVANGMIYATLGGRTTDIYVYNPTTNLWAVLTTLPSGKFNGGAALTSNGERLFALVGSNSSFWTYNLADNTWQQLANLPARARVGATLGYYNGTIYATEGKKNSFYGYDLAANVWSPLEDVPYDRLNKKIGAGASMATLEGAILFMKGAKSNTLYTYEPEGDFYGTANPTPNEAIMAKTLAPKVDVAVIPNPVKGIARISVPANTPVAVGVYTTNGRLVKTFNTNEFDASTLANGIYLLKVTTNANTTTLRLVVEN